MSESMILGPVVETDPAISHFVVRGDKASVEPKATGMIWFIVIFSLAFEALLFAFHAKGMMNAAQTLLMCFGYGAIATLMLLLIRNESRKGPWVVCDLKNKTVCLPRIDVSLTVGELSWVYVEEWRGRGMVDSRLIGEVQVLFASDGRTVRLPVFAFNAIEAFERGNQLAEVTGIPLIGTTEAES